MSYKIFSGTWEGVDGILVQVEADVSNGLPVFELVGYLSSEVKEAKERVRTALKNQGYTLPAKRITVNLAPAHIRKSGSIYDLAIGISILIAADYLHSLPEPVLFLGEIGLNGNLKPVQGVLPVVLSAVKNGIRLCFLPDENKKEAQLAKNIICIGVKNLSQTIQILNKWMHSDDLESFFVPTSVEQEADEDIIADFSELKGQSIAKRAIEIAVSGHHNLLMYGNPGSGKSALAKRIPSIMPSLSYEEKLELTKIYSISGNLEKQDGLVHKRPFRAPHHSITPSALVGGGSHAGPGEVSLAHKGVLFLDEMPEFQRTSLDMMREPLEEGRIVIARNRRTCIYPADFILIGAMNCCPCGNFPDRKKCFCSEKQIRNYQNKLSGPLMDRIDMSVYVQRVPFEIMRSERIEESSKEIRKRVEKCRKIQRERYVQELYDVNAHLDANGLEKYCHLKKECEDFLETVIKKEDLSYRSYVRILKLSRTIADMEGSDEIKQKHLEEATIFRLGWKHGN